MTYENTVLDEVLKGYVGRKEMAKELGVSAATLSRYYRKGIVPRPVKVGTGTLFHRENTIAAFRKAIIDSGEKEHDCPKH